MGSSNEKVKLPEELSQPEIDLIMKSTNMSKNDVIHWYKEFYLFSNGKKLDKQHFIKYYKELLPYKGDCEDFCKLVFNALDTEKTDSLNFCDFIIGFTILSNGDIEERLRWMFSIYDQNKDGFIDFEELRSAIKAILMMTDKNFSVSDEKLDEVVNKVAKILDHNSDQKITLDEFLKGTMNDELLRDVLCPKSL